MISPGNEKRVTLERLVENISDCLLSIAYDDLTTAEKNIFDHLNNHGYLGLNVHGEVVAGYPKE